MQMHKGQQSLSKVRHEAERRIEMSENLMEVKHLKKYFETPKGNASRSR